MTRPPLPAPTSADAVLELIQPGTVLIVPLANGEPRTVMDAVEASAENLRGVTVHQMHALYERPYLGSAHRGRLDHVSYFLSPITRPHFAAETVDLVPANFSEVPALIDQIDRPKLVLAAGSPPDRHGYISLGTNADYVAPFLGRVPWFVEVNPNMPRSFGRNQIHLSQVAGWCEADYPLIEAVPKAPTDLERTIGAFVAERIPNRACIQAGIGGIPNAVLELLADHHDLGIHTELLADGIVDLIEAGAVTGIHKQHRRGKVVTTFALGTRAVYDFLHENPIVELLPVDLVNDPRFIGGHDDFVSINATTEVDLFGQCASETIGGRPWSGSGGQADFARGAMYSRGGKGFIVLPSTANTAAGRVSRIRCQLTAGSVVTTSKNTVDHVVTEYGVAELRGRSLRDRTKSLIAIAHPDFRDELRRQADELGFI